MTCKLVSGGTTTVGVWRIIDNTGTGVIAIEICTLPNNKRPSLCITRADSTKVEIIATFSSDRDADTFGIVLDLLVLPPSSWRTTYDPLPNPAPRRQ